MSEQSKESLTKHVDKQLISMERHEHTSSGNLTSNKKLLGTRAWLLGARTLLEAPGLTTRSKKRLGTIRSPFCSAARLPHERLPPPSVADKVVLRVLPELRCLGLVTKNTNS